MFKENNVPSEIKKEHVGSKVLYRLPNNAIAKEGVIDGLSPEGSYILIQKTWVENNGLGILAMLSTPKIRRVSL